MYKFGYTIVIKYTTIATQYTEIILIKEWQECIPDNDLNQVRTLKYTKYTTIVTSDVLTNYNLFLLT